MLFEKAKEREKMSQLWEQVCKTVNFIVNLSPEFLLLLGAAVTCSGMQLLFPPKKAKESEGEKE